jgi:hypothetical protein
MEMHGIKAIGSIPPRILPWWQLLLLVMTAGKLATETEVDEIIGQ